ncbi:MAG: hypothetical protein KC435_14210 [Thermomicrobiales bacterium]|nr:hypothetical protein [Thermomicrobiales bacterium]
MTIRNEPSTSVKDSLREHENLTLAQCAKDTGVSSGTIKRFEQFAAGEITSHFRYEPWGAEYLERWIDGTLTPEIRTKHDIQRILERDTSLSRGQVKTLVAEMWAAYDRVRVPNLD